MRSHTFPSTVTPDEGISKPEAVNVLSALFRPTSVNSATRNNGCIAKALDPTAIVDVHSDLNEPQSDADRGENAKHQ